MSGNNYASGKGLAFRLEQEANRQHKAISVSKLDNGCDGYSAIDDNGNRLDFPARPYSPQETRHVKSMIWRLFGIRLLGVLIALGTGVMIYLSNMPAAAQVP